MKINKRSYIVQVFRLGNDYFWDCYNDDRDHDFGVMVQIFQRGSFETRQQAGDNFREFAKENKIKDYIIKD